MKVTQSCPTLCDPMDCSLPGSSVHRILQARILEWVAISFFLGRATHPCNPLQCSCLENPVDRGAWRAAVHRVAQSWTRLKQLSMHSCIEEGNGNPPQYSCLENLKDRGAWWAAVYGVAQSQTRLMRLSSINPSQGMFATQGSNPGLLRCRRILIV